MILKAKLDNQLEGGHATQSESYRIRFIVSKILPFDVKQENRNLLSMLTKLEKKDLKI